MRILFLTSSFNSLAQRLWVELTEDGHDISIELDIGDDITREAIELWQPDVVLAPFLTRAIPADVCRSVPCLIVHPGPLGDKGPSSLDWAIQLERPTWGVTVLQAAGEMDGGPVWATQDFAMRPAPKSSIYRKEVTQAAVLAVRDALDRMASGLGPLLPHNDGSESEKPVMHQSDRRIDWATDATATVLAKVNAADGQPGVRDTIDHHAVWLHDVWSAPDCAGRPGALLGCSAEDAVLRATADGAVWIGHLKTRVANDARTLKLPAAQALRKLGVECPRLLDAVGAPNRVDLRHEEDVAIIRFPFLNGAMSVARCKALNAAIREAVNSPARAILLTAGPEFWSNGIDLTTIEAAESPADESWEAINAIDDVCQALLEATDKWVIAAMQGNAGAGGAVLALTADEVIADPNVIVNPHYRNMGGLHGSEYWTYLMPRRLGLARTKVIMDALMPIGAHRAARLGLIDIVHTGSKDLEDAAIEHAMARIKEPAFDAALAAKAARRAEDEAMRPLAEYRAHELDEMRKNFFGADASYHDARTAFVARLPRSETPLHLARHRRRKWPLQQQGGIAFARAASSG